MMSDGSESGELKQIREIQTDVAQLLERVETIKEASEQRTASLQEKLRQFKNDRNRLRDENEDLQRLVEKLRLENKQLKEQLLAAHQDQ